MFFLSFKRILPENRMMCPVPKLYVMRESNDVIRRIFNMTEVKIAVAIIPENSEVEKADLAAEPVSKIPTNSPARAAVRDLPKKLMARVEPV